MLRLKARAKVNWAVDVRYARADGLHEMDLLLQSVDWGDEITLEYQNEGISLRCTAAGVPEDERNLAWRAAELMREYFDRRSGVSIDIKKTVPIQAGLGGGSADAAAVMVGLRAMWGLEAEDEQLEQLAASLGSDVPFLIRGGLARARGTGVKLERLCSPEGWPLVIVKPEAGLPTGKVFQMWDTLHDPIHPDIDGLARELVSGRPETAVPFFGNALQAAAELLCPEVGKACEDLRSAGALGSTMSGSGSAVLGLFPDEDAAERARETLEKKYSFCAVFRTVSQGPEIL